MRPLAFFCLLGVVDACIPIGDKCSTSGPNLCCEDQVGVQGQCQDMGQGLECISGVAKMQGRHDDCPYFLKPCSQTPNGTCGWDDPNMQVREACEHEHAVCGEDDHGNHVCMPVAKMQGRHDDCPYFLKPCSQTPNGTCGWDDPNMQVREACEHENAVCGEDDHGNHVCMTGPPVVTVDVNEDDCKYMGMLCKDTPECGWKDKDPGVQSACEHENAVCGTDMHGVKRCQVGPPILEKDVIV